MRYTGERGAPAGGSLAPRATPGRPASEHAQGVLRITAHRDLPKQGSLTISNIGHHWHGFAMRLLVGDRPPAAVAPDARSRGWLRWVALAAILIAGNLANALSWSFAIPIDTGAFSVALAAGLYAVPGWGELRRTGVFVPAWRLRARPTLLALAAGLALALPSVLFIAIAAAHGSVGSPIQTLSPSSLLVRELLEIPLLTAFLEELIFRQYVYRLFAQTSMRATVLLNAGLFTLWHLVVNARTVLATQFVTSPLLHLGEYVGSLGTIFVGGAVFAWVRWRTGSFVYSAIAHWVVVGLLTLAVRLI